MHIYVSTLIYSKYPQIRNQFFKLRHLKVSYLKRDLVIIRVNVLISDLKLFLTKGAPCEENETCFLYNGVSYLRVLAV